MLALPAHNRVSRAGPKMSWFLQKYVGRYWLFWSIVATVLVLAYLTIWR